MANVGDSGVVILRHKDAQLAGSVGMPNFLSSGGRSKDPASMSIAFLSQQQLRSFNFPYQLGFSGSEEEEEGLFETPMDANVTGYAVRPGDVAIVATDGLFDNVELDEMCHIAIEWEKKWFSGANEGRHLEGGVRRESEAMDDLATRLCYRARELSVDKHTDSPFAILAKENDIMWGGGMPDDCTVVALRVTSDPPLSQLRR
mmetsp:Transcript_7917/g.20283  ORF Transcript_7917/g.20283 Transcript_7917/m.20283 type:complete len:202 (+) Transcript_7917:102-707(+)